MRNVLRIFAASLLLPLLAASAAMAQRTEGTWTITRNADDRLQLSLHSPTSDWGNSITRSELRGLSDATIDSRTSVPVRFRIEREAGAFTMEGAFREGHGAGHYTFEPNRAFASALGSLGIEDADRVTDRELMTLALAGASSSAIREFEALGFDGLTLRNVIELSIHGVSPEYVRSLRKAGISGTNTVSGVVKLHIHRITPEYVRELADLGLRDLPRERLLQMAIHGVMPAYIREIREAGHRELTPGELVKMRIHGVTPAYIREMRAAGLAGSIDGIVAMRIHGVTVRYVRELAALGYRDLPRKRLLQMAIHGVTPEFIRELREAGFTDLSAETLVKMRIHDIGPEVVRRRPVRGEA